MTDKIEISFGEGDATNPYLEQLPMGPGAPNHLSDAKVEAWFGRRPIVVNVSSLMEDNSLPDPDIFQLLNDHEIWVVFYSFGIYQRSNFLDVVRSRLEVEYAEDSKVTIFQVFPESELIHWGEVGGEYKLQLQLSEDAQSHGSTESERVAAVRGLLKGNSAELGVKGKVLLSLNLRVATPLVTAAGINNDYGLWEFKKKDIPLVGDHEVGHVLLVRRAADDEGKAEGPVVKARVRFSIDIGYFSFWTSRRSTEWQSLTLCPARPKGVSS